jgi:hypothetical protein
MWHFSYAPLVKIEVDRKKLARPKAGQRVLTDMPAPGSLDLGLFF